MFFLSCLLLSDPQYGTFYINVWKEILFAQVLYPFMAVRHNPELRRMNFFPGADCFIIPWLHMSFN